MVQSSRQTKCDQRIQGRMSSETPLIQVFSPLLFPVCQNLPSLSYILLCLPLNHFIQSSQLPNEIRKLHIRIDRQGNRGPGSQVEPGIGCNSSLSRPPRLHQMSPCSGIACLPDCNVPETGSLSFSPAGGTRPSTPEDNAISMSIVHQWMPRGRLYWEVRNFGSTKYL